MRIGNGAIVSVNAIGEARLSFRERYLDLGNVYFISNFSRNLISISMLGEQSFGMSFNNNKIFISNNGLHLYFSILEDGLYVHRPYEIVSYSTELFKVAKPKSNKRQKLDSDLETYM